MTPLGKALSRIAGDLVESKTPFALVGGLAVSARTEPRFTRDADVAAIVDSDEQAEAVVYRLKSAGYSIDALVEQEAVGRIATVRLSPSGKGLEGIVVDLLFASSGIEREVVESAERLRILEGIEVPVATIGHLIALKVLSRDDVKRPQDLVDLRALLNAASDSDLGLARRSLALISARGYGRGRDLLRDFESLQAR
ncbi:MAG TPA: nucleotidyl transferase AbiEii/AbiGii toxin family protein [Vicinamibacteria bacterium]